MRYVFAAAMFALAGVNVRALVQGERTWRKAKAEYEEQARIADLPDAEFVAWCKANGRG